MNFWWVLLGIGLIALIYYVAILFTAEGRKRNRAPAGGVSKGDRDLGANINPSQTGNQVNLFPDRTGARTRRELGARDVTDRTFQGDRVERQVARPAARPEGRRSMGAAGGSAGATGTTGTTAAAAEGQVADQQARGPSAGGLAPEAEFGENRPAIRAQAPDTPPVQWNRDQAGIPGDHFRNGHHRSATANELSSTAKDPAAHAPLPGPGHIPPQDLD